jgi:hypothetical protein
MPKIKPITIDEFRPIMERNWVPVQLKYDTLPTWMKKIPELQRLYVYASGSNVSQQFGNGGRCIIGGIDVLREARSHGDPVNFNKDHYLIISDAKSKDALLMYGPLRDEEHWINDIPAQLRNVEILSFTN